MSTVASTTDATAASTTKSVTSKASLAKNFDTFLTMLTTQLKNQDPLSPMDSTEFTNQLVQFASVEQQINANSNLESLITLTQTSVKTQAADYIGKNVEMNSTSLPLQDGQASFSYTLDSAGKNLAIVIKDSSGSVVRSLTGDSSAGRHEMTWDGKNSSGQTAPDGLYSVTVAATDAESKTVGSSVTTYGKVTAISADGTSTLIGVGDAVTSLDKILTIRAASSSATASNK